MFATAGLDSANDIIRYSLDDKVTSIIIKENALAVRIAIDEEYKAIYWIKYISQFMYNILKTDYNGTTSIVQNITVTSSDIAIGLGKRVYYILDPPNSQILKFNKSNNVLVGNITTFSNPLDMIVARGKNAICYLTHAVKVPSAAKLYIGIRSYFSSRRTLYTKLRLKCRNSH